MGRPAGWMMQLTGRSAMKSPGAPKHRREVQRRFWGVIAMGVTSEAAVAAVTTGCGIEPGRLNQPIRVAITGCTVGAGVYETLSVLGRETALRRLDHAAKLARATGGPTEQKAAAP